jgi:hypothetical protein
MTTFATDATVGIEIEACFPYISGTRLADYLANGSGFPTVTGTYSASHPTAWTVKSDGSISPHTTDIGFEIVSPPMTMEQARIQVPAMVRSILAMGGYVNASCGLHIHMGGMGRFELPLIRNLVRRFINFEDTLDLMQPEGRRGNANGYCLSNRSVAARLNGLDSYASAEAVNEALWAKVHSLKTREGLVNCLQGNGRYVKLNLQSLPRHGTIEVRHPAGTLEESEIMGQIEFFVAFASVALNQERLARRPVHTVETQAERVKKMLRGIDPVTARNIRALIAKHNPGVRLDSLPA